MFYKLICETNDYFNKRKLQTTFVSSKEDILSITQIYFRKSEKEKSESEFSLSSKSILQWFTLTTATTALQIKIIQSIRNKIRLINFSPL